MALMARVLYKMYMVQKREAVRCYHAFHWYDGLLLWHDLASDTTFFGVLKTPYLFENTGH